MESPKFDMYKFDTLYASEFWMNYVIDAKKSKLVTPIYSRSLERKKVQAFCLLQIFFSGIRTT